MARSAPQDQDRQGTLFDMTAPAPPWRSDERAFAEMVETLEAAKAHPWSARLLGWKQRTFAVLAQKLTPIEAAALTARLDAELARLGPAED